MARFYSMSIQPTLFGECAVVREWGRIGRAGQVRTASYPSLPEAEQALAKIERQKTKRGYSLLQSPRKSS
ncbi:WGR domain-containing protein [Sinorhizobium saheli]|uniref:WGR domain-containing protein n=1 Tax=Sinorhizobium saheli TaxID=36856 RepID=UPI001F26522F